MMMNIYAFLVNRDGKESLLCLDINDQQKDFLFTTDREVEIAERLLKEIGVPDGATVSIVRFESRRLIRNVTTDKKTVDLLSIFSKATIKECVGKDVDQICEIIEPLMGKVNKITGQENDTKFYAYIIQHAINSGVKLE